MPSNDHRSRAAAASAALGLFALLLTAAAPALALDAKAAAATAANAQAGAAARPKAEMIVEESSSAPEPPPPAPVGDERRAIGEYVRSQLSDIQSCYEQRLKERDTLRGKLIARFDIGPSGKVIGASADGVGDRELIACVVGVVRKWEFEKPQSGGKLRIAYPFLLQPRPAEP